MVNSANSDQVSKRVAHLLLNTKSISFNTQDLFEFVSGIKSPVYIDNRKLISYPDARKEIVGYLVKILANEIGKVQFDVIAGTATAGIPWAAWTADQLDMPLIYVRSTPKNRGLEKQLEGVLEPKQRVVVIEDL